MRDEFDVIQYLRFVQVNVPTMIALVAALVAAAPAAAAAALLRALTSLVAAGKALEGAYQARLFAEGAPDARPYDNALDRSWAGMIQRLQSWSQLPPNAYPEQARAARLLGILAADGLVALSLPYREQWAALKARLAEVSAQGLDDDLAELTGRVFVDDVRVRFADYGRVLGLTQALAPEAKVDQGELLRAAQQRVTEYVIQVAATVDPERPETLAAARAALRPLAEARDAANAARRPAAEPEAPKPDAPAPPPVVAKPDAPVAKPEVPAARPSKPPPARPSAPPPA